MLYFSHHIYIYYEENLEQYLTAMTTSAQISSIGRRKMISLVINMKPSIHTIKPEFDYYL